MSWTAMQPGTRTSYSLRRLHGGPSRAKRGRRHWQPAEELYRDIKELVGRFSERPVAATLIVTVLVGFACSRGGTPGAAEEEITVVPVGAQPAQRGRIRAVVHASGTVVPAPGAEFLARAPEPARVIEVTKMAGDTVAPGEVLVRFEVPSAAQEVARQEAEVASLQALVENTRIGRNRTRELIDRGLVPRADMDRADRELADAEAALASAQTLRAVAEAQAARSIVTAPFAATVAQRLHNPGDLVQAVPTDPVLRLVDPTRLEILATVPRADIARVAPGASARLAGGFEGHQVRLSVTGAPTLADATADGNARVRLTFTDAAPLMVDTPVQVDIDAEERANAVFVVPEAVIQQGGESIVFIAAGDVAQRRAVTTGVADEQRIEIVKGVRAGELVITRGHTGLSDGMRITVAVDSGDRR